MSNKGFGSCPLCLEQMDLTDKQMKPCNCGYEICVWCWNKIIQTAEKDDREGLCPACRNPYDKEKILGRAISPKRLAAMGSDKSSRLQKPKPKMEEKTSQIKQRKDLENMRVIRRNLVYVSGVPLKLADEKTLRRKEFFGQYGKVVRIIIVQDIDACKRFPNSRTVYITFLKEEEACRCINVVDGYSLDGYPLRACYGTTRFCHAWISDVTCRNPNCFYFHGDCSEEDMLPKNEAPGACLRMKQMSGITVANGCWRRSGSILPPPIIEGIRTVVEQAHSDNWKKHIKTGNHVKTDILAWQSVNHDHMDSWRKDSHANIVGQSWCASDTIGRSSDATVAVTIPHAPIAKSTTLPSRLCSDATMLCSSSLKENQIQNPTMKSPVPVLDGAFRSSPTHDRYFETGSIEDTKVLTWKTEKHNSSASEKYGVNIDGTAKNVIVSPGSRMTITKPAACDAFHVLDGDNDRGSRCPNSTSCLRDGKQPDSSFCSDSLLSSLQDVSNFTMHGSTSTQAFPSSHDWSSRQSCLTSSESSKSMETSDPVSFPSNKLSESGPAANKSFTACFETRACAHAASCNECPSKYEQHNIYNKSLSCEETNIKYLENQSIRTRETDKNLQQRVMNFDTTDFARQSQHIDIAEQEYDNQISDKDPLVYSMIAHIFSMDDDEINDTMGCSLGKWSDDSKTSKSPAECKPWMLHNGSSQIESMENIRVHNGSFHCGSSFSDTGPEVINEPVYSSCRSGINNSSVGEKWGFGCNEPRYFHGMQNCISNFSQVKERSHSSFPDILHRLIPGSNYDSMRTLKENYEPI